MQRAKRLLLVVLGLVVVGVAWFEFSTNPITSQGAPVTITVTPGQSVAQVASLLERKGVIASALAFRLDALVFGTPVILPGTYVIPTNSSDGEVRGVFGVVPNANLLNVSAGMTVHQIALQLATVRGNTYASNFLNEATVEGGQNAFGAPSLEGLLGTGSYVVTNGEPPRTLLKRMKQRFLTQFAAVGMSPVSSAQGLTAYQVIIAASIVEKEGYYPKNMPQVGRVILNRLHRGGGLQMDATILYSLGLDGGKVTHAMLQLNTPYNTYLHPGLTPTPICQVSTIALNAVLHPPQGSWLYFVVIDKAGTEAFATTFAEQLANERLAASRGL